jgi:hypothetical protein
MDRGRRRLGQPLARLTSAARTPGARAGAKRRSVGGATVLRPARAVGGCVRPWF